jgi:hypothetical protein
MPGLLHDEMTELRRVNDELRRRLDDALAREAATSEVIDDTEGRRSSGERREISPGTSRDEGRSFAGAKGETGHAASCPAHNDFPLAARLGSAL